MSNPSSVPARCIEELNGPRITVKANGRFATFLNPDKSKINKIDVDCWLKSFAGLKSDFLLVKTGTVDVIIELKGKDIDHAVKQILVTLGHWRRWETVLHGLAAWWFLRVRPSDQRFSIT